MIGVGVRHPRIVYLRIESDVNCSPVRWDVVRRRRMGGGLLEYKNVGAVLSAANDQTISGGAPRTPLEVDG